MGEPVRRMRSRPGAESVSESPHPSLSFRTSNRSPHFSGNPPILAKQIS